MVTERDAQNMVQVNRVVRRNISHSVNLSQRRAWFDGEDDTETGSEQQGLDWTKVEAATIPVDVLKQHPEYAKLLNESIQRRQEITNLKKQIPVTTMVTTVEGQTTQPTDNNAAVASTLAEVQKVLAGLRATQERTERDSVIQSTGITVELYDLLQGDTHEGRLDHAKRLATSLGIKPKTDTLKDEKKQTTISTSNANPANGSGGNDSMKARLISRMRGGNGTSPFDVGVHIQTGGGTINDLK